MGKESRKKTTSKQKKKGKAKAAEDTDDFNVSLFDSWPPYINDFDVCVTTYDTLRQDLYVARDTLVRPARSSVEYSRDRRPVSPLVICEWYRVIMDEVWVTSLGIVTYQLISIRRFKWSGEGRHRASPRFSFFDVIPVFTPFTPERWCLSFHAFHRLQSLVHLPKPVFPIYPMFSS
jgi:hypothetical protein